MNYQIDKVSISLVECLDRETRKQFRFIMDNYHSYMTYKDTCNRRINWLVYADGELGGAIGVNSAILALGSRDSYIEWNKEIRLKNLNSIANNYRFALTKTGIGSQVLSALHKIAPVAWKRRYGDELILLETLVKPPWNGAVYKASN